jgi:hypothetical protein
LTEDADRAKKVAMELKFEFGVVAKLAEPLQVGPTPFGLRLIFTVVGGRVEGERIKGEMLGGGADWMLVGPDGWGRLDVRGQIRTDDGAILYIQYPGVLEMNEKVQLAVGDPAAASTDFGDQYFRTTPRLEAGDPRYAWVNQTLFVAEGRLRPGPSVEYRVHRVT